MNTLHSLLNGFRRIKPADAPTLRPYFDMLNLSRYFCSTAVLATNPFYMKIEGDVLLVMKRQWISGYPIIYLMHPPLTLNEDHKLEREWVDEFAAHDIPARMTMLDAIHLDMEYITLVEKDKDYIYNLTDADVNRKHRYIKRNVDRLVKSGRLLVARRTADSPSDFMIESALDIVQKWHTAKGESPMRTKLKLKQFKEIASNTHVMLSVSYFDGIGIDCTLSELYAPNKGVNVFGYYDPKYTSIIKDWARYEYVIDNAYWMEHSPEALFASGGTRDNSKKLTYAKNKINPISVNRFYQQANIPRFSAASYHQFCEDRKGNLIFKEEVKNGN